jgi:hypothetical protein
MTSFSIIIKKSEDEVVEIKIPTPEEKAATVAVAAATAVPTVEYFHIAQLRSDFENLKYQVENLYTEMRELMYKNSNKPWSSAKLIEVSIGDEYYVYLLDFDGDGKITQADLDALRNLHLNYEQTNELYQDFPLLIMVKDTPGTRYQSLIKYVQDYVASHH